MSEVREAESRQNARAEDRVTIEATAEVVAALGHVKRCDPVLAGRCPQCDLANARAIVEPMQSAPVTETRASAAAQARLRKAN
jgi:hypothetical protein